jgi:hypothetical protein
MALVGHRLKCVSSMRNTVPRPSTTAGTTTHVTRTFPVVVSTSTSAIQAVCAA